MFLLLVACTEEASEPASMDALDRAARVHAGADALDKAGVTKLRWGMAAYREPETFEARWQPIWDRVGEELGVEIELVALEPYEEMEAAMARGDIDGATFWPWAYVAAAERLPLQLIGTHIGSGSLTYGAYVIALEDQAVRDVNVLEDLEGTPFGYVHPRSTSGFLFPAAMFSRAGLDPLEDIDERWFGTHAGVYDAVTNGEILAGAVFAGELEFGPLRNPEALQVRIVAKSPRIPYGAYVLSGSLPTEAADGIGMALNGIDTRTPHGRALLAPLQDINGFLPVKDSHYDDVRGVRDTLESQGIQWPQDVEF
ncbi:MAG: phosphate/phosphite/phosphonate ABC transporter substrate-binding protein [Proteobacteria bacterium]|nr:phosphate/phosphite/phosphonate ABC transporter substrate-binding protein [Pseudomonadota bacterium]MCP4915495.1 phosphate/phosphite/phosphonate ABC transporter substrate-binding protein [Pseudomonadota bacterium]